MKVKAVVTYEVYHIVEVDVAGEDRDAVLRAAREAALAAKLPSYVLFQEHEDDDTIEYYDV